MSQVVIERHRRAGSPPARRWPAWAAVLAATLLVVLGISAATGAPVGTVVARARPPAHLDGDSRPGPAPLQAVGSLGPGASSRLNVRRLLDDGYLRPAN